MTVNYTNFNPRPKPKSRFTSHSIFGLVLFAGIVAGAVAVNVYKPLRAFEAFVLIMLYASPLWLAGCYKTFVYIRSNRTTANDVSGVIYVTPAIMGLVFAAVLFINADLDKSAPVEQVLTISGKSYSVSKHGSRHYYFILPITTASHLPFKLDGSFHQSVSFAEYSRIIPNYTQANLTSGGGFLGLPWEKSCQLIFKAPEYSEEQQRVIDDYVDAAINAEKDPNYVKIRDADFAQLEPKLANAATYKLATKYVKGDGVARDDNKAFELYQRCANAGSGACEHDVAAMYDNGLGVERDAQVAFSWMKKAAEDGNAPAQDDLGVFYGDGKGVSQDWVQSYFWISRSAGQGNQQALKDLDYAKSHMTAQQIAEAGKLVSAR